jgi:hypothetical protein
MEGSLNDKQKDVKQFKVTTNNQNYGFTVSISNKKINLSIFHEECGSL